MCSDPRQPFCNGIPFEGDEGWVFCTRSEEKSPPAIQPRRPDAKHPANCAPAIQKFFRRSTQRRPLDAQPNTSWKLAGKHRRQPASHRTDPAIRAQPRSLSRRVDQHETQRKADVGCDHGNVRNDDAGERAPQSQGANRI